jgi:DNA-binding HxlR family transcriptional regulator
MAKTPVTPFCPRYHYAVELIGRRWTGAIVRMLLAEPRRFAELGTSIPDLSDRMLAERLRELEQEGIVSRTVVPEIPVRVEYALTPMGRALEASIRALGEWAEHWLPADAGQSAHAAPARKAARRR